MPLGNNIVVERDDGEAMEDDGEDLDSSQEIHLHRDLPVPPVTTPKTRKTDPRSRLVGGFKAVSLFSWEPILDFAGGIRHRI